MAAAAGTATGVAAATPGDRKGRGRRIAIKNGLGVGVRGRGRKRPPVCIRVRKSVPMDTIQDYASAVCFHCASLLGVRRQQSVYLLLYILNGRPLCRDCRSGLRRSRKDYRRSVSSNKWRLILHLSVWTPICSDDFCYNSGQGVPLHLLFYCSDLCSSANTWV